MKRTTLMLPEQLRAQAKRRARLLGISFGELVRRSVEAMLKADPGDDSLLNDTEVFEGPVPADLVENHDRYLYGSDA